MAFSMHSHSGEFCPGHAKDSLEDIILKAISRGMKTFALTEHMPRTSDEDLYPEEIEAGHQIAEMLPRHEAYLTAATHLRTKYTSLITILIGFESEYIRPSYTLLIHSLASDPRIDFWVGSIHHVYGIPIDFDRAFYLKAIEKAGGSEEKLWEDYFDVQYEMLKLKPKTVGHFDLIRLFSEKREGEWWGMRQWKGTWERVERNLRFIVEEGMLLEVNTAGFRKGLGEPYPGWVVCGIFVQMGGKLTLSDDSHSVEQVGTHYESAFNFLENFVRVKELWVLTPKGPDDQGPGMKSVALSSVKESFR